MRRDQLYRLRDLRPLGVCLVLLVGFLKLRVASVSYQRNCCPFSKQPLAPQFLCTVAAILSPSFQYVLSTLGSNVRFLVSWLSSFHLITSRACSGQ
jgi:hypothetical protein